MFKRETLLFCLLFLLLVPSALFAYPSPWVLGNGEKRVEGIFLSIGENLIQIETSSGKHAYRLAGDVLAALMGKHTGRLLSPEEFPPGICAELFITKDGCVRAFRNKQEALPPPDGTPLAGWGHEASLSPDETCYTIYNLHTGLYLYSPPNEEPLFLSAYPVLDWNGNNELAFCLSGHISVYDTRHKKQKVLNLPPPQEGIRRVIKEIKWNISGDKFYYASLEDYPDIGSDVFRLTVLDAAGNMLGSTFIPNLGCALWLENDLILYITYENMEAHAGRMMLWNYKTGKTVFFQAGGGISYQNAAYNQKLGVLAYTGSTGVGETVYLLDLDDGIVKKITTFPTPLRNLQWSAHNTLFFWDELNNCIVEIKDLPGGEKYSYNSLRTVGYLPPKAVRNSCIFFLEEPMEEPQQPFIAVKHTG